MEKVRITITIDADALKKAKMDAAANDRTLSNHINRLIKEYQINSEDKISMDTLRKAIQIVQGQQNKNQDYKE